MDSEEILFLLYPEDIEEKEHIMDCISDCLLQRQPVPTSYLVKYEYVTGEKFNPSFL